MAGSPPNFHKMDSRSACIQGVLKVKVKVKGHVIRALSWILGMSYSVIDGLVELYSNVGVSVLSIAMATKRQCTSGKHYWMIVVVKIVKVTIAVEAKVSKQVNLHIAKIANESRGVGMGH